tara:strand:- start:41 stop:589 length:549 start_codon:yes stop_codon:yes gene_type:complete
MELRILMVNPNQQQMVKLDKLRSIVLDLMLDMEVWNETNTQVLKQIKLGVLRKNATQRHGVTRWKIGSDVTNLTPQDVEVIDIHPELLDDKWNAYAAFVLHHEYIHALGFREHNSKFRFLENEWPGNRASKHGSEFTEFLRFRNAKWIWNCNKCGKDFPRKKPSRGRYKCRECDAILKDRKV